MYRAFLIKGITKLQHLNLFYMAEGFQHGNSYLVFILSGCFGEQEENVVPCCFSQVRSLSLSSIIHIILSAVRY